MQSSESMKREIIEHLSWCLEKMKFYESTTDSDEFEYLYRSIYNIISTMREMDSKEACIYYREKIMDGFLVQQLKECHIELNV